MANRSSRQRAVPTLLVWAFFALVSGTAAPSVSAAEGCAHDTVSGADRSALDLYCDPQLLGLLGHVPDDLTHPATAPDLPCSGPSCSEGSGVPFVPTPLIRHADDPCCDTTAVVPSPIGPNLADDLSEAVPRHPQGSRSVLERPPRRLA